MMARLLLFVTSFISLACSSRIRLHEGRALISSPAAQLAANVFRKSQSGKDAPDSAAMAIFEEAPFFEQCGAIDDSLTQLSQAELTLSDLGKLAKSGQFFASEDRRWLVKAIKDSEANVLASLNKLKPDAFARWYESCSNFQQTLLSPILLSLDGTESFDSRPYIVMRNETAHLKHLVEPLWDVEAVYDMKPLPNLAEDLGDFVESMKEGFLSQGASQLQAWQGWDDVKAILQRDVAMLAENNLVDYSLFVHVFKPIARPLEPFSLGAESGCIVEPTQKASICFRIIDYLTKYTLKRQVESMYKHEKFHDYSSKMVQAVDCIGDLSSSDCTGYVDYKDIIKASADENSHVFSTLLASETFKSQYECAVRAPRMVYDAHIIGNRSGATTYTVRGGAEPYRTLRFAWKARGQLEQIPLEDTMFRAFGSATAVEALSAAASVGSGGRMLGPDYVQVVQEKGKELGLKPQELEECRNGIHKFATSTNWFHSDNKDLLNVLWNPQLGLGSVIVVRKKRFWGLHSDVAAEMRTRECFLRTAIFYCRPKNNQKQVVFDYKHSFGDVEVLVVEPSHISGSDYEIWKHAKEKRLV